jgi:hypothetical protein
VFEAGDARGEPVAVGGERAHLRRQPLGLGVILRTRYLDGGDGPDRQFGRREGQGQSLAAAAGHADEGNDDERERSNTPQAPKRQSARMSKRSSVSILSGAISIAIGSFSTRRITSLKTLAESGNAGCCRGTRMGRKHRSLPTGLLR